MSITKTLGGDRLGSGKKQKVHMHGYERSTHDMSYLWRSTMSAGTLVPFLCEPALPGDTFDIELDCDIKTHPTIGPLFGGFKVQLDLFVAPVRLYQAFLHNNWLNIGRNMAQIKLPVIKLTAYKQTSLSIANADLDNLQINPSCILSYLGIRGIGFNSTSTGDTATRHFNAIPLLAYWEIYKNYYANKQEEIGAVIHTPLPTVNQTVTDPMSFRTGGGPTFQLFTATPSTVPIEATTQITIPYVGATPIPSTIMINTVEKGWIQLSKLSNTWIDTGTQLKGQYDGILGVLTLTQWRYLSATDTITEEPVVTTFPLSNIDDMRQNILKQSIIMFEINTDGNFEPYSYLYANNGAGRINSQSTQEGLAIKTYQSDLLNNWIKTEWVDEITTATSIDTTGGSFAIDTLNFAKKLYDMYNRIAVSGGTYDDWMDVVYDHERYLRCETPMYMGGLIKELVFQEVTSNSETSTGQPLGTLAGKGIMGNKHKGGHAVIKIDEISYIIGIISLTPRLDYSQGNKWDVHLKTMDDFHKPVLDQIGFQDLITEQMAWWDTTWNNATLTWDQKSAGKQPAWTNYMTNLNQTRGNFAIANNEMFMTLNRRYESLSMFPPEITDLTTYIDPKKFNFIFAETALDAQNFWAQIAVNMEVRRKMSAKVMPAV